jgi:hypothetical protein
MTKAQGRRSNRLKNYYAAQYNKTRANKIRRLKKRLAFDPSAVARIKTI